MKLRNTVRILEDNGTITEIPGEFFPYAYNGFKFQLMVHESVQPWTPHVLDISEVTTGCRCCSTNKTVSATNKEDIKRAMDQFIQDKGLRNFQAQIKKRQNKNLTR